MYQGESKCHPQPTPGSLTCTRTVWLNLLFDSLKRGHRLQVPQPAQLQAHRVVRENTGCPVKLEFEGNNKEFFSMSSICSIQYLGDTYIKKLSVVHLKLKLNQMSCIFIC